MLIEYGKKIKEILSNEVLSVTVEKDELILKIKPESIKKVFKLLRDHTYCRYEVLVDVTVVDYPDREERFDVVYFLLSMSYNARIRVVTSIDETTAIDSVTSLYSVANWYEREVYDMFGVYFKGHPDLRRILTDYGFSGHPLRKDFPLTGYYSLRYDEIEKRVISEPVEIAQEYRGFSYLSPWAKKVGPKTLA